MLKQRIQQDYMPLEGRKRVKLKEVGLFADGAAAKQIGKNNYELIKNFLDDSITVDTDEICAAVKILSWKLGLFLNQRSISTCRIKKIHSQKELRIKILSQLIAAQISILSL